MEPAPFRKEPGEEPPGGIPLPVPPVAAAAGEIIGIVDKEVANLRGIPLSAEEQPSTGYDPSPDPGRDRHVDNVLFSLSFPVMHLPQHPGMAIVDHPDRAMKYPGELLTKRHIPEGHVRRIHEHAPDDIDRPGNREPDPGEGFLLVPGP